MRNLGRCRTKAMFGLRDIGSHRGATIDGCRDVGNSLRMKELTGRIRITTTTAKAGGCMKAIGTAKTMTTVTGANMIADTEITMIMIMGMTTTIATSSAPSQ